MTGLALVLALAAGPAPEPAAADVAGRVVLGGIRPAPGAVWVNLAPDCPRFIPDDRVSVRDDGSLEGVVVALDPEDPAAAREPPAGPLGPAERAAGARDVEVRALHCGLEPRVQVARPGSLLAIREEPGTGHRLRLRRDGNPLDGGVPLDPGRVAALPRGGIVDVRCEAGHEWEIAWIAVEPSRFVAVTGPDGRFSIADVPAGRYRLRAWHPHLGTLRAPIEVDPGRPSGLVVAYSGRGIVDQMYGSDVVDVP